MIKGAINKARQQKLFNSAAFVLGVCEYVLPESIKAMFGADVWSRVFELSREDTSLAHFVGGAGFMVTHKGFNMAVTLHNIEFMHDVEKVAKAKL